MSSNAVVCRRPPHKPGVASSYQRVVLMLYKCSHGLHPTRLMQLCLERSSISPRADLALDSGLAAPRRSSFQACDGPNRQGNA